MLPRQITHQNIFWVLIAGFSLVIVLLLVAAFVGIRNIQSIRAGAASMVSGQEVTNRLIDELHTQQTSLSEVFSLLARDPDSLDFQRVTGQLDEADRDIDRISAEGTQTAESRLWARLKQSSLDFSKEARRLLTSDDIESYASLDLFRYHAAFVSVINRLIEVEYHKVSTAQAQIDRQSERLSEITLVSGSASILLALVFAAVTVRMVSQLVRAMDWQSAELARVSWHMLEDQEATARRFSHELHDELGQSLTAVKTNLTALDAGARVQDSVHLVDEAIGNVRQMSQLLRPTILDDFGLEAGIRWLADGFRARTGIDVTMNSQFAGRLADETETHLFRIAQEALTNIARHAEAKHVQIELQHIGNDVRLSIKDDGRGMGMPDGRGMGMIGMRARARASGGDVSVRSTPGQGVLIEVEVPIRNGTNSNSAG
jgi:signal transduction histidine kinase